MRQIKFRGKSLLKNEWWHGFYVYSETDGKHYIVQDCIKNGNLDQFVRFAHYAEVNPATIGQFTGLTDRNGKEIYEGDIVKIMVRRLSRSNCRQHSRQSRTNGTARNSGER